MPASEGTGAAGIAGSRTSSFEDGAGLLAGRCLPGWHSGWQRCFPTDGRISIHDQAHCATCDWHARFCLHGRWRLSGRQWQQRQARYQWWFGKRRQGSSRPNLPDIRKPQFKTASYIAHIA